MNRFLIFLALIMFLFGMGAFIVYTVAVLRKNKMLAMRAESEFGAFKASAVLAALALFV